MKNICRITIASLLIMVVFASSPVNAGNLDRSGQAAAAHLLINPWASTNGWGTAGISFTKGIEAMYTNVAGMAFTQKTEIAYSNTLYNIGSQTMINGLGIVQSLGKEGRGGNLGLTAMIMSFGEIPRTTVEQPEGGLGTFTANATNIGVSYARTFSEAIHAGVSFKLINEFISNANATGFAIDLGVQYVSGRNNQFRLGVVLKNIGLPMSYRGDGMTRRAHIDKNSFPNTFLTPSESSEMPALLGLGISYDFLFDKNGTPGKKLNDREDAVHRLTIAGSYVANAYSRDQIILGLEYSLMDYFQVRCGYTLENLVSTVVEKNESGPDTKKLEINTNTNLSGPSAGASVLIPINKKDNESPSRIAIDYSYRFTKSWNGCHAIGLRIIL